MMVLDKKMNQSEPKANSETSLWQRRYRKRQYITSEYSFSKVFPVLDAFWQCIIFFHILSPRSDGTCDINMSNHLWCLPIYHCALWGYRIVYVLVVDFEFECSMNSYFSPQIVYGLKWPPSLCTKSISKLKHLVGSCSKFGGRHLLTMWRSPALCSIWSFAVVSLPSLRHINQPAISSTQLACSSPL